MDSTSARLAFEDAVFEHYRNYIRKNDPQRTKSGLAPGRESRGIENILQKYPPTQPLSSEIAMVLRGFRDVECLLADYSSDIARIVRNEPAQVQFTMFWTGEEALHGWALDEILIAHGTDTPRKVRNDKAQLLTTCRWDPSKIDIRFLDPWYGPVCYVTLQERVTANGYRWLGERAKEMGYTALWLICKRLEGEEARHGAFYLGMARLALSFQSEKLRAQMVDVIEDFAMPGKYALPIDAENADKTTKSALPEYEAWTKTAQSLGIVPDPIFAVPVATRLQRQNRVLSVDEYTQERRRIDCWNSHVKSVLGILRELKIELPRKLRYLQPIPTAAIAA